MGFDGPNGVCQVPNNVPSIMFSCTVSEEVIEPYLFEIEMRQRRLRKVILGTMPF